MLRNDAIGAISGNAGESSVTTGCRLLSSSFSATTNSTQVCRGAWIPWHQACAKHLIRLRCTFCSHCYSSHYLTASTEYVALLSLSRRACNVPCTLQTVEQSCVATYCAGVCYIWCSDWSDINIWCRYETRLMIHTLKNLSHASLIASWSSSKPGS